MSTKLYRQESKEFQMKVIWPLPGSKARPAPGTTDRQIFKRVSETLTQVIGQLAGDKKSSVVCNDNLWRREGIRYDTAERLLKQNNLTLAIEATDERTKLKCKQHNFVPELLFDKPKNSICAPSIKAAAEFKKHDAKLKLEEDMHFSNIKYCASGSLFRKGRRTSVEQLQFFSRYFPALETLAPAETPLQALSHWDEAVFDDMLTRWGKTEFDSWMLVNRWDWGTNTLLESELSFKVDKAMDEDWDYGQLKKAAQLYLALQKTGVFQPAPPIFFFDNPVSSTDITIVKK